MDTVTLILGAFADLVDPLTILLLLAGALWGVIGGAIPGITSSIAMALLLPFTFVMDPHHAIVLLAATWSGAEYGGAIPAILINTPGAPGSAATTLDGYPLAQQGKAGKALGVSLTTGLLAQAATVLVCAVLLIPLSRLVLAFGAPEVFAVAVFGLSIVSSLGGADALKTTISTLFGLSIATIGFDPFSGISRFTFGQSDLQEGLGLVPVLIGLFAVGEALNRAADHAGVRGLARRIAFRDRISLPTWAELRRLRRAMSISTVIGLVVGIMPGAGSTAAAFVAYSETRRWSKNPEKFGKGSYEGVAAAEASNNAAISGQLVPTLAFAVPGSASAAVFMGGLLIHGIRPGPGLFSDDLDILAMLFVALLVANLAVLVAGLLVMRPAVWLVGLPEPYVLAGILAIVVTGAFSYRNRLVDVAVVVLAGLVGFAMKRFGFSPAAAVIGFVLGVLVESNWRRTMTLAQGDLTYFLSRPIALTLLVLAAAVLVYPILGKRRRARRGDKEDGAARPRRYRSRRWRSE